MARERGFGRSAVAHPVDGEAVLPQAFADALTDHRIVFDQQDSQTSLPLYP
jgi:hypothetical protein